ncbi:MAG: MBL fold metallo-hydrolase [Acidobacteriia bacterium]|nr:MBL fold metallo-hydrolase [Terriglobia bacterium]
MVKRWTAAGSLVAAGMLLTPLMWADASPELQAAVDKSMKAMGAENLKTLVISGQGWDGCVGQPYDPNSPNWRKFSNKDYVRSIDLEKHGWRLQRVRGEGETPGRGGCGAGPIADQTQNQVTNLAANSPWATQMEYILLPEGFLQTALQKNATVKAETVKGKKYTVISFLGDAKAPVTGYINDLGYVDKVETTIDNNVLGDMVWSAHYTDWKDFGGVKFPTHIVQYQGPPKFFELTVSDVKANVPVDLSVPDRGGRGRGRGGPGRGRGRGGAEGPISEDLGGGFWLINGPPGGYGSVVADFQKSIVVIEGPQNDMRAEQIIAEAKRLVPNKPIRYVINTHAHFDHSGGLRAFVAEGATIITHKVNKGYYEKIFKDPHTLVPDKLSQMKPQPKIKIETMTEKKVLTDGTHTIELYHVQGSTHNAGMLIAYLPKQKVVIEADEFNVGAANAPTPATINPYHTNLLANIERLKLDVDRIIPIHLPGDNRKVTLAELKTAAGKN